MKSPHIELQDDQIFLHGLDFNRFAKDVAEQLETTPAKARDLLARALSAKSYHDLRDRATEVVRAKWATPLDMLERASLTRVAPFSPDMPDALGPEWQTRAVTLFDEAVAAQRALTAAHPGRGQFIAIVGAPESGKTSLARHLAHTRGGAVRDITLYPHLLPFESREGAVYVYDRPAELPPPSHIGPESIHPEADFSPQADLALTLRKLKRNARASFPFHEWNFFGIGMAMTDAIKEHPSRLIVLTFASVEALRDWVKSLIHPGFGDVPARYAHEAVQVVDLDAMTFETIYSPPVDRRDR